MPIHALMAVCTIPAALLLQQDGAQSSGPSVAELVKVHGISEQIIVGADAPLAPAALLGASDLVLRGVVRGRNDRLSDDARAVWTDYTIEVIDVVHPRSAPLGAQDVVTVRRPGGVVNVAGRTFLARENGFAAFNMSEEYFLFLRRGANGVLGLVGGAQGAYRVSHGNVQMFKGRATDPAISVNEFTRDVRAELDRHASR